MEDVVIVSGTRTAIGAFGGEFRMVPAVDLGAAVIREVMIRAGFRPEISEEMNEISPRVCRGGANVDYGIQCQSWEDSARFLCIDEVIMGNVLQSGQGQNPARQAMIRAGLPSEVPATTVNKVCASGLKAIEMGMLKIMAGMADTIIAGGMENMSRTPMGLPKVRWGHRMEITGCGEVLDLLVHDGLWDVFCNFQMGNCGEIIAEKFGIGRQEQDELAVLSHQRAVNARNQGWFQDEIVPITVKNGKKHTVVDTDSRPRETSLEKLTLLEPAFKEGGCVTAGNSTGINDAAAAVLLMSAEKAARLQLEPIVKIKASASAGVRPEFMGLGSVPAINKVLKVSKMAMSDIDLLELNEAFAAQALGCYRELELDPTWPNELGSGISLGHPIGCTGARQVVTGMYQMKRKNYQTGIVTMCVGGGMGMAMLMERV